MYSFYPSFLKILFPFFLLLSTQTFAAISGVSRQISTSGTIPVLPKIALNPVGNGLSVWTLLSNNQIQAVRFNAATNQFSAPFNLGFGTNPQVGIDSSGNGLAVWSSVPTITSGSSQIQAARFNGTTLTWSLVFINLTQSGINSNPILAVNNVGNAVALWNTFPNLIQGATFNAATLTWTAPVTISTNGGGQSVSVDQNNFAIAVWQDFSTSTIQSLRFTLP